MKKKAVLRGIKIFIVLSIVGLSIVYFWRHTGTEFEALVSIQPEYVGYLLLLTASNYVLGGLRLFWTTCALGKQILFRDCIQADFSNTFLGAITPMQTGGGPAQIFILHRAGLSLVNAIAVSCINWAFTVIVLFSASSLVIGLNVDLIQANVLGLLFRFGYLLLGCIFLLVILMGGFPDLAHRSMLLLKRITLRLLPSKKRFVEEFFKKSEHNVKLWWESLLFFVRKRRRWAVGGIIITGVQFWIKFTLAYYVIRSIGLTAEYNEVLILQVLLMTLIYFSPSPGGSGIAEIAAASLMGLIIPPAFLMTFTLLWRFFIGYLGIVIGGIIFMRNMVGAVDTERL